MTRLIIIVLLQFLLVADIEAKANSRLIAFDQEDARTADRENQSLFGRLLSSLSTGDQDNDRSLRGSESRFLQGTDCESVGGLSRFWTSCSNKDKYTTGNIVGNGNHPNRPDTIRESSTSSSFGSGTILGIAAGSDDFDTLVDLVVLADLDDTLEGDGPFTVFAPIDDAFDAVDTANLNAIKSNGNALSNILLYHVVPGTFMASNLTNGMVLTTAQSGNITITVLDGTITINGESKVVTADIVASNGVIHAIDTVLTLP